MLSLKEKRIKRGNRPLSRKCGCGKVHVVRDNKLWAKVLGQEWYTKCFISTVVDELAIAYRELAMYKMLVIKLKEDHPEINFEEVTKQIHNDVTNTIDDQEEAAEILSKEIEARENERNKD